MLSKKKRKEKEREFVYIKDGYEQYILMSRHRYETRSVAQIRID